MDAGLRESLRLHTLHLHLKQLFEDRQEVVGLESLSLDFWVPGFPSASAVGIYGRRID